MSDLVKLLLWLLLWLLNCHYVYMSERGFRYFSDITLHTSIVPVSVNKETQIAIATAGLYTIVLFYPIPQSEILPLCLCFHISVQLIKSFAVHVVN